MTSERDAGGRLVSRLRREMDLQDGLLVCGVVFLEWGTWLIWKPAAFLLAGVLCLSFAWLIERDRARKRHGNGNPES